VRAERSQPQVPSYTSPYPSLSRIRFFTTTTGEEISSVDTGSQVCTLIWSPTSNELASTQGYSTNTVVVWKYPSSKQGFSVGAMIRKGRSSLLLVHCVSVRLCFAVTPLATLTGHNTRVLYSAMSPDGQTVCTGAGDETLRFWHLFPPSAGAAAEEDDDRNVLLPGFSGAGSVMSPVLGIR
jgi:cell division cycle 20-like protein 1, cofactor of APC complex